MDRVKYALNYKFRNTIETRGVSCVLRAAEAAINLACFSAPSPRVKFMPFTKHSAATAARQLTARNEIVQLSDSLGRCIVLAPRPH